MRGSRASHPLTTCFIDHSIPISFLLLRLHRQHCLGDPPATLRAEDYSLAIWSNPHRLPFAASEPSVMKEVGQSTLPLMLEREVSSNPFCVSGFQQQAAASRSQQQASSSVVSPWLTADLLSSTRKWVRGNESISSVEGTLSRGKRETDIWRVCKLCPEGEISMSTLNRKLKWLFKENAGMRSSEKII